MSIDFIAANGAGLSCTLGSSPGTSSLTVAVSKAKGESQNLAVVSDKIVGTFGTCSALGPGPCAPALPGNWSPGCTKEKISGTFCLKKSDTLSCSIGGTISITSANQTKVKGE